MSIQNVSLADAGGYYCKAVNRYGSASVRVHLNVRGLFLTLPSITVKLSVFSILKMQHILLQTCHIVLVLSAPLKLVLDINRFIQGEVIGF